jgi:adenylate cyclase
VLAQLELRRKLIEHEQTIRELDETRTELAAQKARAEELLDNVLPAPIADELKKKGRVQPKYTRSPTILFADFQDFTLLAERTEPATLAGR